MTKDYTVGKGRPPEQHRFKKGESGNKNGRPKKSPTIFDALIVELGKSLTVTIDGSAQKVPTRKLLAQRAVREALKGRVGLIKLMLELDRQSVVATERLANIEIEAEMIRAFELLEKRQDLNQIRRAQQELRTKYRKPRRV